MQRLLTCVRPPWRVVAGWDVANLQVASALCLGDRLHGVFGGVGYQSVCRVDCGWRLRICMWRRLHWVLDMQRVCRGGAMLVYRVSARPTCRAGLDLGGLRSPVGAASISDRAGVCSNVLVWRGVGVAILWRGAVGVAHLRLLPRDPTPVQARAALADIASTARPSRTGWTHAPAERPRAVQQDDSISRFRRCRAWHRRCLRCRRACRRGCPGRARRGLRRGRRQRCPRPGRTCPRCARICRRRTLVCEPFGGRFPCATFEGCDG